MTSKTSRRFPDLLDEEEQKSLLAKAELLWRDLQNNDLGGYSGQNRPFWIVASFIEVIEKYGRRDVGLTWSKLALDAANSTEPRTPAGEDVAIGAIAHAITGSIVRVCCHKTGGHNTDPKCDCRDVAAQLLEVFPEIRSVIDRQTIPNSEPCGWRSMDTAPTNGDQADIWLEPHDAEESGNAHRRTNAYFKNGDWWFRANDGSRDVAASYHWKVTAWMPIPEAPRRV